MALFFRTFPLFTLFGFRVRLDVGWLLLATLVVVSRAQVFSAPPFELGTPSAVALGLFFAFGLLMSIVLHELSHSLVARRHGIGIRGITLFILGGVSEMDEEPKRPGTEFLVAIAGPLSSFGIAAACALAAWTSGRAGVPEALVALAWELALLNGMLGLFNLVPAFPLDGGRVLRSILWALKRDVVWASLVAGRLGQAFGIGLIGLGLFVTFGLGMAGGLLHALIGWFLFKAAPMPWRMLLLQQRLQVSPIAPFVDARPVVVDASLSVAELLARVRGESDDVVPVVEAGRIVGVVRLSDAVAVADHERRRTTAGELATPLATEAFVATSTSADEALRRMQRLQLPALLVVEASRLIGVVRWHDLLRHAQARA